MTSNSLELCAEHWFQVLLKRIDQLEKALQSPQTETLGMMTANVSLVNGPMPSDSLKPRPEESALHALCILLKNPKAKWKTPEQEVAVLAALECTKDILAVLPTGSGKSMITFIPPFLEKEKVTVVIFPLHVLLLDHKRKLTDMGLPFEVFKCKECG
jgi:hypothetical protein